ncbi:septal ring lytic transglycosylase RlpA family protein [Moraxella sp. K127]|nr:septal ring lytic transglycosylase RlpA family protein [Moraxella sp. K1664]MBE9587359.1 septal ring lytic transglycosylase RlpA family protein [Moraxella sp. K1630]MBE9590302.1 septal ring lytic transglycosylase RlpA family protein [Moraxella sp. K127]MBE9595901.1 septal ring lytic transglycosylase RlpA family protein [Moraxella sp. K2450]MDI4483802.1 septal ring lytic transglycosylase RlpA family protein [Moraxella lacunata]
MQASAHSTTASYYADKFNGRKTANGEVFSNNGMTCASNRYKLGTYVEVTNAKTGKSITCKVNDRIGKAGRIDLTKNAFKQLAPLSVGLVKVQVKPVDKDAKNTKQDKAGDVMLAKDSLAKDKLAQDEQKTSENNQDGTINLALEQDK